MFPIGIQAVSPTNCGLCWLSTSLEQRESSRTSQTCHVTIWGRCRGQPTTPYTALPQNSPENNQQEYTDRGHHAHSDDIALHMTDRCKRVLGWALCPSSLSCGGGSHSLLNRWPLNWSCGWLLLEPPRTLASSSASTTSRHLFSPLNDSPCRQLSRATPRLLPCDSLSGNGHTLQLRGPLGHPRHLDTSEEPAHITNPSGMAYSTLRVAQVQGTDE